jgi:ribosomal protein S18 acetylase RimI-like enzyme
MSPPLAQSARKPWESAGFVPFVDLALMRLDLVAPVTPPQHLVVRDEGYDLDLMLAVDTAAFERFWQFSRAAFVESLRATSKSSVFVIRDGALGITGYAIVGYGHAISYLQRVAVDPKWQSSGMGRSLIRAGARSARRQGSKALLLNTQLDNVTAAGLYETEGYVQLPDSLAVLKAQ